MVEPSSLASPLASLLPPFTSPHLLAVRGTLATGVVRRAFLPVSFESGDEEERETGVVVERDRRGRAEASRVRLVREAILTMYF
jgi:hypothetical protein